MPGKAWSGYGYRHDRVAFMICQFQRTGDALTCSVCGRIVKTDKAPDRVHATCGPRPVPSTENIELPTTQSEGCGGCTKRKEWLNEKTGKLKLGDKVESVTKATGIKAAADHFANKRKHK